MPKIQIVHIHGGTPFDSRDQYLAYIQKYYDSLYVSKAWPESMQKNLWDEVRVLLPKMPAKENADYEVWKIAFEKLLSTLDFTIPITFTARSLGTIFLMKYLSENTFLRPIHTVHLVAVVFDGEGIEDEGTANFILDPEKLQNVPRQVGDIHLWHSVDDPVCPWHHVEKYQKYFPDAILHQFEDRGHFWQSDFQELFEQLKKEIN